MPLNFRSIAMTYKFFPLFFDKSFCLPLSYIYRDDLVGTTAASSLRRYSAGSAVGPVKPLNPFEEDYEDNASGAQEGSETVGVCEQRNPLLALPN